MNERLEVVPTHVSADRVVDWDFNHVEGADTDAHLAWKRLHDGPTVVWTPYYGGHWIATRAEAIRHIQLDHEIFSHKEFSLPRGVKPMPLVPLDLDPPEHTDYRRILNLAFAPKVIAQLKDEVRKLAVQLIDELAPKGQCDFTADFARKFPVTIFLRLVDLPLSDRELFLEWAENLVHGGNPETQAQAFRAALGYLKKHIDGRRESPGSDLFSQLLAARVHGQPMAEAELMGMTLLLFFGGLDTVAGMMGFIARHLATHPAQLQQLVDQPELIPTATEEFIRRFGLSNTVRLITRDVEFYGAPLKRGELIMVPISLSSMDEQKWENPMAVDFSRKTQGHDTFGNGPHRCPGANLARIEITVFLEEWLRRIPRFTVTPGDQARTASGAVNGVTRLPLSWVIT